MSDPRSRIPSVDALLATEGVDTLVHRFGRPRTVEAIRTAVDAVRAEVAAAGADERDSIDVTDAARYTEYARHALERGDVPSLRHVVNATGVVLHTNLGRAPLAAAAAEAMAHVAAGYTNLEFDLEHGTRGSRYVHCVSLLTELFGADDALVVNNAAAALVLALNTVALGRGVAVSRGELVEIGGGFRIPEMLERAGARLVEVGSTNRTRLADYARAVEEEDVAAILKVHRSNFRISGFTEEAPLAELSGLAREHAMPLVHDLGSGLVVPAEEIGLPDEPRAAESLSTGTDIVVVSGDKLLGGPQAGIVIGKSDPVARMRRNPLCRALRVDKVTLAGLEATLRLYRDPERARTHVPVLAMLLAEPAELETRAQSIRGRLGDAGVRAEVALTAGAVGGGTFPGVELPSRAVALRPAGGADALAAALRDGTPPVVGRIVDDALLLDVRTVAPDQEDELVRRVVEAWQATT